MSWGDKEDNREKTGKSNMHMPKVCHVHIRFYYFSIIHTPPLAYCLPLSLHLCLCPFPCHTQAMHRQITDVLKATLSTPIPSQRCQHHTLIPSCLVQGRVHKGQCSSHSLWGTTGKLYRVCGHGIYVTLHGVLYLTWTV